MSDTETIDTFNFEDQQIKDLVVKLCELGDSLGYQPQEFAVLLSMSARYLADAVGVEVIAERVLQS